MAAATWRYRGDPEAERPAALGERDWAGGVGRVMGLPRGSRPAPELTGSSPAVRFANGKLRHPDSLSFTVYRNRDTAHPRKKHRRILVRAGAEAAGAAAAIGSQ